ncbi:RNA-binding protein 45 isoform X2 [Toxorhynchites rutilus septentrionalis]|uniref:RNA-binding protein 45 isoform X2 n=1 Tax=Toxorhynchites rutilus septentrionalis TaxID=329112 RepID=UPI00247A62CC|nr:RNA-binding protein 45 isoform X2 [Toxorhynchites rutilus septentrionalis]
MADRRSGGSSRNNFNDEKSPADIPPMSRLFIICSKTVTEDILREQFSKFGEIEEIWIVKDRQSGDAKGVAYIKFSKTSEAAKALEEMNGKTIGDNSRPIKVLVAANRQQGSRKQTDNEEEKYLRLFVLIPKEMNEESLREEFGQHGTIDNVTIIRDKVTKEGKGFAYVKFSRFTHAARAFEECDPKYKAVFAEPKPPRNASVSSNDNFGGFSSGSGSNGFNDDRRGGSGMGNAGSMMNFGSMSGNDRRGPGINNDRGSNYGFNSSNYSGQGGNANETTLTVLCSPSLNQDQLWRLFDIIPGLDYCQINNDFNNRNVTATVVYNNAQSAMYARDKIHGLEYPPGERLIIRLGNETVGVMTNNDPFNGGDRDASFCSVPLPQPLPMANPNADVAQRCFIVCIPKALPTSVLKQTFCRFGDLIDVYLLPNKNCGYAKFASEKSAKKAMETLHGAEILNVRLKVLEAEEPSNDRRKRMRHEERMDNE